MPKQPHLFVAVKHQPHPTLAITEGRDGRNTDLIELGRLPKTQSHALTGAFMDRMRGAPATDVHIFGLPEQIDLERLAEIHVAANAPCLFVRDSGQESALA